MRYWVKTDFGFFPVPYSSSPYLDGEPVTIRHGGTLKPHEIIARDAAQKAWAKGVYPKQ